MMRSSILRNNTFVRYHFCKNRNLEFIIKKKKKKKNYGFILVALMAVVRVHMGGEFLQTLKRIYKNIQICIFEYIRI